MSGQTFSQQIILEDARDERTTIGACLIRSLTVGTLLTRQISLSGFVAAAVYDLTTDLAVMAAANEDDEATPLDIANAQFHTRRRLATVGETAARIIADCEDEAAK